MNEIKLITILDENYPIKLREIYDPPTTLYVLGNAELLNSNPSIAMVGCRECSDYGKAMATRIAFSLAKKGINIISGMARGIDSFSHVGALNAKGKTVAVVGCGVDIVYPPENKKLFNDIISSGGAVISEYPIATKPEKKHFPARNRIISGLSDGLIVVEAKERSGTLITVDFALEQGRNVYVVPGNVTSQNSVGTNDLAKQGAKIITSIEDILEDFY